MIKNELRKFQKCKIANYKLKKFSFRAEQNVPREIKSPVKGGRRLKLGNVAIYWNNLAAKMDSG